MDFVGCWVWGDFIKNCEMLSGTNAKLFVPSHKFGTLWHSSYSFLGMQILYQIVLVCCRIGVSATLWLDKILCWLMFIEYTFSSCFRFLKQVVELVNCTLCSEFSSCVLSVSQLHSFLPSGDTTKKSDWFIEAEWSVRQKWHGVASSSMCQCVCNFSNQSLTRKSITWKPQHQQIHPTN